MPSLSTRIACFLGRIYSYRSRRDGRSATDSVPVSSARIRVPRGFCFCKTDLNGVGAEVWTPKNVTNGKIMLYLHGGGFRLGINNIYRKTARRIARITGSATFLLDYTANASVRHPSALEETYAAFSALAERYGAPSIYVSGDSAGSTLTLALLLRLKDDGRPQPAKAACMSVWADLAATGDSYRDNCHKDPVYGILKKQSFEQKEAYLRRISPYVGTADPKDPFVSPAYGDFQGVCPLLLQCGGAEISASDTVTVYDRARAANVCVTKKIYEGLFHDFQIIMPFIKEGRAAWRDFQMFFNDVSQQ